MREKIKATRDDWEIFDMPEKHDTFTIKNKFSKEQIENLSYGHIPDEMEDRWFSYMEDNKMYIHRSWSGICVYVLSFRKHSKKIDVTVNRDPEQYSCTDNDEDTEILQQLLDWWS